MNRREEKGNKTRLNEKDSSDDNCVNHTIKHEHCNSLSRTRTNKKKKH